jgi:hypothetical protein
LLLGKLKHGLLQQRELKTGFAQRCLRQSGKFQETLASRIRDEQGKLGFVNIWDAHSIACSPMCRPAEKAEAGKFGGCLLDRETCRHDFLATELTPHNVPGLDQAPISTRGSAQIQGEYYA